MSRPTSPLDHLRVKNPCPAEWEDMRGNARVRFCEHCQLSVNNLSEMTVTDALNLLRQSKGGLCVRFSRRADGTIRTAPIPEKLHHISRRASRVAAGTFTAAISLGMSVMAQTPAASDQPDAVAAESVVKESRPCALIPATGSASVTGAVLDPNGAVIAGASITLANEAARCAQTMTTDENGSYSFQALGEGTYMLKVTAQGFSDMEIKEIVLQPGEGRNVDVSMTPSAETVTVGFVVFSEPVEPLVIAATQNNLAALKELLVAGADVNVLDKESGRTALMQAVANGNREAVQLLLRAGADINLRNEDGQTALMMLDEDATTHLFWELVSWGAKINQRDKSGNTALINAAAYDNEDIVSALASVGARVNARNDDGQTALIIAASAGNLASVRALIDAGANVNKRDKDGWTALKYAREYKHDEMAVLLEAHGARD